jgi:hypothetical protein
MPAILIIDRNSVVKPYNAKVYSEEDLYKKAGFKSKEGFAKHAEWKIALNKKDCIVELYGKTNGRAGQENKYEFPPPIDNALFFGSCVLVCKSQNEVIDISPKDWETIYDQLYGGFEDISSKDTDDDDSEEEEDDTLPRTKEGYVKDGFIVEDDTEEDSEYSEEEIPVVVAKKPSTAKPKKNAAEKVAKKNASEPSVAVEKEDLFPENIQLKVSANDELPISIDDLYLSCTDELVEESYL